MQKYYDCPQILREFLIYHENIKGQSQLTISEYYLDLRMFLRFTKLMRNDMPINTDLADIDIRKIDLKFIEEIETSEEMNQAITTVVGTGAPAAVVTGPVGPVVEADDDDRIYEMVEENAQFPGGDAECFKWLSEHIKYPSICVEQGVQGRVIVNFVVNRDGSIVDVKTVRSPDPNLTKEAERVVKLMPKWKPARQGNKTVRSRFTLPVMFRLS